MSQLNPAFMPPDTDYTSADHDALRSRLINLFSSVYPTWTPKTVADYVAMMLESNAFACDVLVGYLDNRAHNATLPNATQRREAIKILGGIGYRLRGPTAAITTLTLTTRDTVAPGSTVPVGIGAVAHEPSNDPDTRYRTTAAATLLYDAQTGKCMGTVEAKNAQAASETYYPTALADQTFVINRTPFLQPDEGDVVGVDADQNEWTLVESLLQSGPNDRHVMLRIDQNDRATVVFGNGVLGKIPTSAVTFSYEYGGGLAGRVAAGALSQIDGTYYAEPAHAQVVLVVSNTESDGGDNHETVNSGKQAGPANLRATSRTITREDFELRAMVDPDGGLIAGRALCLTPDESSLVAENTGRLYLIAPDGGLPSEALINAIRARVDQRYCRTLNPPTTAPYPMLTGFTLGIYGDESMFKTVDVQVTCYFRDGYTPSSVKAVIEDAIERYFSPMVLDADGNSTTVQNDLIQFGYYYRDPDDDTVDPALAWSDIMNIVRDTAGVQRLSPGVGSCTLNGAQNDVSLLDWEFPRLGTVTVIDGKTGQPV